MIEFDSEYFDAAATLECGQVFRYRKTGDRFEVISGSARASVVTHGDKTYVDTDADDYFRRYFDLHTDYSAIVRGCAAFPEVSGAAQYGKGIRILRQPLFETLISFIVSANNNIPRIQGILERLCTAYGTDMGGYRAFPTAEQLRDVTAADYRALGAGFRDGYLQATVRTVLETDILDRALRSNTIEAGRLLCTLKGVGRKVADCILLFGMARTDVYPVDVWIFRAHRSEQLDTPDKVRAYCLDRYGDLAGYAQQYIYYHDRKKENKNV